MRGAEMNRVFVLKVIDIEEIQMYSGFISHLKWPISNLISSLEVWWVEQQKIVAGVSPISDMDQLDRTHKSWGRS